MAEDTNRLASRAVSRCYGALFFLVFGAAWLVLAFYAFGWLSIMAGALIAGFVALYAFVALRTRGRGNEAGKDAFPVDDQRRNDRAFGWVNAVTWVCVFLVFQILPRVGHPDLAIPAVAIIVGLHFFPMPPLYRHRANLVTGALIVLWTIVCIFAARGDTRIGFVAGGTGMILWMSAAWALRTAETLLKSAGL